MLTSANVVAAAAATYYEADNYYTAGEVLAPAVWTGNLARDLGLVDNLEPQNFEHLLRGFGPDGTPLVVRPEYPHREMKTVSMEIRKDVLQSLNALLDGARVNDAQTRSSIERALTRKLEQGPLTAKSVLGLSKKIEGAIAMRGAEDAGPVPRAEIASILEKAAAAPQRRAGIDLTFSAPKSVSIQALVFGDTRLIKAHRDAVQVAMNYVEERFSQCRVGPRHSRQTVTTGRLAVAQFEHDLSREKDPHLHTHNVVINMTPADGKMRALHNDELHQHKRLLGTMYQNELAMRARALGYDITPNRNGTFEIAGFERGHIDEFSKRHHQIWGAGISSQREAREHFQHERKKKELGLDREELKVTWKATTHELGIARIESGQARGVSLASPAPSLSLEAESLTEKAVAVRLQDLQTARLASTLGNTPSESVLAECEVFARDHLVAGTCEKTFTTEAALARERAYRADVTHGIGAFEALCLPQEAEAVGQRLTDTNRLPVEDCEQALAEARLGTFQVVKTQAAREAIATVLAAALDEGKKLGPKALYVLRRDVEKHMKADGLKGKEKQASLRAILDPFEKRTQALTHGQITAVVSTLASKDGVVVWQGVAGAGKTYSLTHIARLAEAKGYEVKGLAPSAAAAKQLGSETRLAAETVDSHLLRAAEKGTKPEIWIVDEAGMLPAKTFAALTSRASERGARVLLVGDTRQIPAVEAGNPFLDIQKNTRTTVISLTESVRPRTPQLQETVSRLYARDARGAAWGLRRDTLEAKTREDRCALAAKAFLAIPLRERAQTLVIAKTNDERRLITEVIRADLRDKGKLGPDAKLTTLRGLDYTETQKKQVQNYVPGLVLKLNEAGKPGAKRGEALVVVGMDFRANTLRVQDERGKVRAIPCESLERASIFRKETLAVAKGDRILWTRNDRSTGALNNDLYEVSKVSKAGVTLRPLDRDATRRLTLTEVGLHHVDHAWAVTVHRSQGQTAKHVVLVADERTKASDLLVGVTRATQSVLIVGHDRGEIERLAGRNEEKEIAHEVAQRLEPKAERHEEKRAAVVQDRSVGLEM